MHREKDASVYGFQSVSDVRQGARNDYTHSVVEVTFFHLVRYLSKIFAQNYGGSVR
ncbi:MAG: hypothetical protein ACD_65C00272G0001, partial [uncultured bacterium]